MKPPDRRRNITEKVLHVSAPGEVQEFHITAGIDPDTAKISEVFCSNPMTGSDMEAILTDGSILFSLCLQAGVDLNYIADKLGDVRVLHDVQGPSSSPFGSIARALCKIEKDILDQK